VADSIRFYMDQHIPGSVSRAMVRHGVDVLTAQDVGRCGVSDADQLAFSASVERVLVTFDPDFLVLHQSGVEHSGIAWCPARKYDIGGLIQALLLMAGVLDRDAMRNHVEYL
jgi:hypothetical protein